MSAKILKYLPKMFPNNPPITGLSCGLKSMIIKDNNTNVPAVTQ